MSSPRIIARSHVCNDKSREYHLDYYLISDDTDSGIIYGLTIKESGCFEYEASAYLVGMDESEVLEMIQQYSRLFVFPCHLSELVEDNLPMQNMCKSKSAVS